MTDQLAADGVDDAARPSGEDAATVDPPASPGDDEDDEDDAVGDAGSPDEHRRRRRRVSRWDRPPQPRDWRFYVGGTGKVLIAAGLLVFGFVAFQLWGTGIETARTQNQLENQFEVLLAEFAEPDAPPTPTDRDATTDTDSGTEPVDDPAVGTVGTTASGESAAEPDDSATPIDPGRDAATDTDSGTEPVDDPAVGTVGTPASGDSAAEPDDSATAVPVAVDLADQAVVQDPIPQPFRGEPLLRLEIPKIGRDDIVVPGVGLDDLKDGPGHYPDTPLPGQLGNAAIAGHRTTYGAPFYDVDRLSAGDEIITTLLNGDRFVYEVTNVEIVAATDYWVVATTDATIAELTLTSCHPKYTARDRIVVHSVLDPTKSSNVGVPTFYTLEADPDTEPIPGDDPVLTAPPATASAEPVADAVESAEIEITPPAEAPQAESDDGPAAPVAEPPAADGATDSATAAAATDADQAGAAGPTRAPTLVDAFEEGWFHDAAAFPQIVLWALVLALISVAAYQVAKHFRRVWVGVTLGLLPFLVALYFFYQNVNRLLPAGI